MCALNNRSGSQVPLVIVGLATLEEAGATTRSIGDEEARTPSTPTIPRTFTELMGDVRASARTACDCQVAHLAHNHGKPLRICPLPSARPARAACKLLDQSPTKLT